MSGTDEPSLGGDSNETRPARELESQTGDLHIEVSDLRRSPAHDMESVPWYRQRVQMSRPLAAIILVVMLSLIVLVATPIGSALLALAPHPTPVSPVVRIVYPTAKPTTPTPSPYPTATLIAPNVGPIPTNCPPGTPLVDFAPDTIVPGVGGSDVWLVGFYGAGARNPRSGQRAAAHIDAPQPIKSTYTLAGWPIQVIVLIRNGFTQTVTLTGRDLRTGYSLWFSPDSNNPDFVEEAAPLASIDPGQPMGGAGDFAIWFGVLYLPGAGCYTLQASWPGGGWIVNFAAGR